MVCTGLCRRGGAGRPEAEPLRGALALIGLQPRRCAPQARWPVLDVSVPQAGLRAGIHPNAPLSHGFAVPVPLIGWMPSVSVRPAGHRPQRPTGREDGDVPAPASSPDTRGLTMRCLTCDEYMMLRDPVKLAFECPPGSLEARELAYWAAAHPWSRVWACDHCMSWLPTA